MADHEVISTFLDDEPFDPQELVDALADPAGRALLIDLVALRRLTQPDHVPSALAPAPGRRLRPLRAVAVAAALVMAVAGGYLWGERSDPTSADPPAPTRVVRSETGWQDVSNGGGR